MTARRVAGLSSASMMVGKDNARTYELAFGQMDDDASKTIECVAAQVPNQPIPTPIHSGKVDP